VSIKTVESHRAHVKEKLHLNDTTELVRYAMQWVEHGKLGSA
jgi:DNA-binding CsgD family transcriptional regulator